MSITKKWQKELRNLIRKNKTLSIIHGLLTGFYKIKKCPICGHLYLGENSICSECGYDAFSDVFEEFELRKKMYLEAKNENRYKRCN